MNNSIRMQILELRKRNGITQLQLADQLGVAYQTVSKWEVGTSLPDITMLPGIASYFEVSVDEVLGLKPLSGFEQLPDKHGSSEFWDSWLGYLQASRSFLWNDDYFTFLIRQVWKINRPINVLDFGCGYGVLGQMLLSVLPEGSTYTGIDINSNMLDEGRKYFNNSGFPTTFIQADAYQYSDDRQYGLVICQAFLRHLPNARLLLKNMVDFTEQDGIVACIEVARGIENSGMAIKGLNCPEFSRTTALQKFWEKELETEGRDYNFGLRAPFLLHEYGLKNIGVRMNDAVSFLHPDCDSYEEKMSKFLVMKDWTRPMTEREREESVTSFMNRGLSREEAVAAHVTAHETIGSHLRKEANHAEIVSLVGLLISYGWKT